MKAARAALMLVPILGLHFILLPMRPEEGSTLEPVYEVISAVTSSFQVRKVFTFLFRGEKRLFVHDPCIHMSINEAKTILLQSNFGRFLENIIFCLSFSPKVKVYSVVFRKKYFNSVSCWKCV